MKKNILIVAGLLIIAGIVVFAVFSRKNNNPGGGNTESLDGIILFYGQGCPHCANVDKYIAENNVKDKVTFAELEVFLNKDNAKLLEEKAVICGLATDSIGVPFLWDGSKCISGDQDIINFFKEKIGG
jgi:glutaredoxin